MSLTCPAIRAPLLESAMSSTPISGVPSWAAPRWAPCSLAESAPARSLIRARFSGSVRDSSSTSEACGNISTVTESAPTRPQSAMTSAEPCACAESASPANARPSVGHSPARPAGLLRTPEPDQYIEPTRSSAGRGPTTARPPAHGGRWRRWRASRCWGRAAPRARRHRDTPGRRRPGPSRPAAPVAARQRRSRQRSVVTPGEPLSAARAMSAISLRVPLAYVSAYAAIRWWSWEP